MVNFTGHYTVPNFIDLKREYWSRMWRDAINNMPFVEYYSYRHNWIAQEKGTVPLADYIKASSKRKPTMKLIGDLVHKLEINTDGPFPRQQLSNLARLLNYKVKRNEWPVPGKPRRVRWSSIQVKTNLHKGRKPRGKERQDLLVALAGSTGKALAQKLLQRMKEDGTYHINQK